jgi:integrase
VSRKAKPLTERECERSLAQARPVKLFDGKGLHLHVLPTGTKVWRLKYYLRGKEGLLTIGRFPEVSLSEARAVRKAARQQVRLGRRPSVQRTDNARTVADLAEVWCAHMAGSWSKAHAKGVAKSLARDVLPALGDHAIAAVTPDDLYNVLAAVEERGAVNTARRVHGRVEKMFSYAVGRGWRADNPASSLTAVLRPSRTAKAMPAASTLATGRDVLHSVAESDLPEVYKLAHKLLALTAVRMGSLRAAKVDEVGAGQAFDIEGGGLFWRIPPAHLKLGVERKEDSSAALFVPLAPQAEAVVRRLEAMHEGQLLVSPDGGRGLHPDELAAQLRDLGWKGKHTPHGWRATFSTVMNEQHRDKARIIDMCLGHRPDDMTDVEAAYNRAQLLDARREIMTEWASLILG